MKLNCHLQKLSTADRSTYSFSGYKVITNGFTEEEFDELPSAFYGCYTDYLPSTRLGSLPSATKGYLIAIIYQQPVDRNHGKRVGASPVV